MLSAAPYPGDRAFPPPEARLSLGPPEGPGAYKLSSGRRPPEPRFPAPPGSDRCLGDRLSFVPKERGTRAGSPALPARALPAAPTRSCHSARPLAAPRPRRGRGAPAVSNVHFSNQTPAPARSPRRGQGRPVCHGGILGSWVPRKVPKRVFCPGGGWGTPYRPPPAPAAGTPKHPRAHTPTIARARTTPPPPPAPKEEKKKTFQVVRAPPAPHPLRSCAPH